MLGECCAAFSHLSRWICVILVAESVFSLTLLPLNQFHLPDVSADLVWLNHEAGHLRRSSIVTFQVTYFEVTDPSHNEVNHETSLHL